MDNVAFSNFQCPLGQNNINSTFQLVIVTLKDPKPNHVIVKENVLVKQGFLELDVSSALKELQDRNVIDALMVITIFPIVGLVIVTLTEHYLLNATMPRIPARAT